METSQIETSLEKKGRKMALSVSQQSCIKDKLAFSLGTQNRYSEIKWSKPANFNGALNSIKNTNVIILEDYKGNSISIRSVNSGAALHL